MKNHWIVSEHKGTVIYEQVDYVPQPHSSRTLADEIDGQPKSQALRTLETLYDHVSTVQGSNCIFCKRGDT
jgi:hypothetical protein